MASSSSDPVQKPGSSNSHTPGKGTIMPTTTVEVASPHQRTESVVVCINVGLLCRMPTQLGQNTWWNFGHALGSIDAVQKDLPMDIHTFWSTLTFSTMAPQHVRLCTMSVDHTGQRTTTSSKSTKHLHRWHYDHKHQDEQHK